ncbi:MAG: DNA recombination protein RmuC, partial [Patescibacteria group bacterium]
TIMMGLERAKLEEQAKKIWELLKGVQQETSKFSEKISVLNRHVTNAKNQMDLVSNDYAKLAGRVDQIKLLD